MKYDLYVNINPKEHSDQDADMLGVDNMRAAMLRKLAQKRREGRGGWYRPEECSVEYLRQLLHEHIEKGDMVDVANFAMMIWNRENAMLKAREE